MRKSTRKDGKVRDYTVERIRHGRAVYDVKVDNVVYGRVRRTGPGQVWQASVYPSEKNRLRDKGLQLEGFVSRTHAAEAILKINGFEMI